MNLFFSVWFLPSVILALILYWRVLKRESSRLRFLTFVSIAILSFYQWLFVAVTFVLVYLLSRFRLSELRTKGSGRRTFFYLLSLCVGFGLVAKYGYLAMVGLFEKGDLIERHLIMPLGVSYLCVRLLAIIIDSYRGLLTAVPLERWLTYIFFFPVFPAGPVETFERFYENQLRNFESENFWLGIRRVLFGYFVKLVLLDGLFRAFIDPPNWSYLHEAGRAPAIPVYFLITSFIKAYLDLRSYTDIAIGLSALFGFRIIEDLNAPFLSRNLIEYWRGWHVSLANWCRDYVYFPLFGSTRNHWIATYAAMIVMGFWHRLDGNWTLWGLYHATGLCTVSAWNRFQRGVPPSRRWKVPYAGNAITLIFVALGYAFIATPNVTTAFRVLRDVAIGAHHLLAGPLIVRL